MKYVTHLFMPGHTIKAIIKQHNNMINDETIVSMLLDEFDNINGKQVPKVGQTYKIPIFDETETES